MQGSYNATGRLQSIQRAPSRGSELHNILEDSIQILRQGNRPVESSDLDRGVSRRELDNVASTALSYVKMFDKNENHALTVNETVENEYSFLLIHWSSIVIYSTIIGIVVFLLVMWRISKAKWLCHYLARKCGCDEENANRAEMQPAAPSNSVADAIHQLGVRMQGNQAASRTTKTTINNRWTSRDEEMKNIRYMKKWVEEEAQSFDKPMI